MHRSTVKLLMNLNYYYYYEFELMYCKQIYLFDRLV